MAAVSRRQRASTVRMSVLGTSVTGRRSTKVTGDLTIPLSPLGLASLQLASFHFPSLGLPPLAFTVFHFLAVSLLALSVLHFSLAVPIHALALRHVTALVVLEDTNWALRVVLPGRVRLVSPVHRFMLQAWPAVLERPATVWYVWK